MVDLTTLCGEFDTTGTRENDGERGDGAIHSAATRSLEPVSIQPLPTSIDTQGLEPVPLYIAAV